MAQRRVIRINNTQDWINIKQIYDNGIIKIKQNKFIKIMEVIPINYNLKSDLEKEAILNSYKIFLKTCNFDIQILIQSNKENLNPHISKIKKYINKEENKFLKDISENYIKYISEINNNNKSASKRFYIIIKNSEINKKNKDLEIIKQELNENYIKIKECLLRCGNIVIAITKRKEIINLFYSFFNIKNI